MFRRLPLMIFVFLIMSGCTEDAPTDVPIMPTAIVTAVATSATAPIDPPETAVAPAFPTLPTPSAMPDANTDDLLALVQSNLPVNAFDGLVVLPLYSPSSIRPLWAVHSGGFRNFDLNPLPSHFVAIYTYENGNWRELAWQNLDTANNENHISPDILTEDTVTQVGIESTHIWLAVDGYIGAHGGAFQLLRFDGNTFHTEVTGNSASPGVGYLEDLNNDNIPELILRLHDAYVFCYACGVRNLNFQLFTWDAPSQQMVELTLQPTAPDHPAYQTVNKAIQLAQADLWPAALAQIQAAPRTADNAADSALLWNTALIRLYNDAWQAELNHSPYPLLTHIFYGDYDGALDIMRVYGHEQIFNPGTPLIQGTMAEGYNQAIADYILGQTNGAIAAKPDLAAAYYLRAWANFLQNPAHPQIESDLRQAATLEPTEPLFSETAVPTTNRIQFTPGATSAEINRQVSPQGIDVYVLGAAAGQSMTVELFAQDDALRLQVHDRNGGWLDGQITSTLWHGQLPETADYIIRILDGTPSANYTLRVTIPSRIQFTPGAISAQIQGDLTAHESDDYILRALAGQTMAVTITSPNSNVLLTLVGADGIPLTNGLMSGAMTWHGQLPATQDYIIRAIATGEATTYTLDVTIE